MRTVYASAISRNLVSLLEGGKKRFRGATYASAISRNLVSLLLWLTVQWFVTVQEDHGRRSRRGQRDGPRPTCGVRGGPSVLSRWRRRSPNDTILAPFLRWGEHSSARRFQMSVRIYGLDIFCCAFTVLAQLVKVV